jgi:hypothetical protein
VRPLRSRATWFGIYLLANLGIIAFSISLWFRGMPLEGIFVGLWAPTLVLLYLMFLATFDPFRRFAADRGSMVTRLSPDRRAA